MVLLLARSVTKRKNKPPAGPAPSPPGPARACAVKPSPPPEFRRKWCRVTSGLPLAAILRPRVCAPYLSWSARDPLSANPSPPRGPISTPTRYKKAVDAGVGGGRERGGQFPAGARQGGTGLRRGKRCDGRALRFRLTLGGEGEPGAAAPGARRRRLFLHLSAEPEDRSLRYREACGERPGRAGPG